ncbi:MAG: hypothetical protein QM675_09825 [Protaetiibacter sp.]
MLLVLDAAPTATDAATSAAAPIVVLAALAVIAAAAIGWSSAQRRARNPTGADAPADASADAKPRVLWGLYIPGAPVQKMAKPIAIGFITFDPEETSRLVRSTDGGANWWVVPRAHWKDAPE